MGGQTQQNTTQTQQTTPWAPAAGTISSILGNVNGINPNLTSTETGALNQLGALGAAGNPYAAGVSGVANSLLAGGGANNQAGTIGNAYAQYRNELNPYLQSSFLDPRNTPGFGDALIANQYNQNVQNQLGAMGSAYGAGNTTGGLLSGLQQQFLANQQAGIGASQQATQAQQYGPMLQLQAEAQRRGIPLETLAAQMGIALPAGQAFGTQVTQGKTTTSVPLAQQIAGGVIGGAGLLGGMGAFGKNGWLNFGGGGGGGVVGGGNTN
jgi:hypothetical protein